MNKRRKATAADNARNQRTDKPTGLILAGVATGVVFSYRYRNVHFVF